MNNNTQKKTVREWLQELPEGYKERALAQCTNPDQIVPGMEWAIFEFTNWEHTKEGVEFWKQVFDAYFESCPYRLPPLSDRTSKLDDLTREIDAAGLYFPDNNE